ncbi:MAG: ParB/RepB/Spo0J family partition protein [Deltaproteobacteria bacterium]|nr:ParB/RepB/Spo0J family partition protein [Deltaproteobacteria bacterium]NIS76812.1 ParB/RepB/Spo0J family partition protein [Deltaproteobacteria bacterium]
MKKKVLGKGLEALIPRAQEGRREYDMIPLAQIRQNPNQPRKNFKPGTLAELVHSIKEKGVIQPILIRKVAAGYELVAGERRLRAAREAGLETIPAVVRNITEGEALEMAIIENVQREDLNPMEVAEAFATLGSDFGLSQEEIAAKVGKERPTVANYLRLLKLPLKIREGIVEEKISMGHAKAILTVSPEPLMQEAYRKIVARSLSVRQAEVLSRSIMRNRKKGLKNKENILPVEVRELLVELQKRLGARVKMRGTIRRGVIEIHYASMDQLDGIVTKIKGE